MTSPSTPDLLQLDLLNLKVEALRVALAQLTDVFMLSNCPAYRFGKDNLNMVASKALRHARLDPTAVRCALLLESQMGRAGGACGAYFDTDSMVIRARIRSRLSFASSLVGEHRNIERELRRRAKGADRSAAAKGEQ